MATEYPPTWFAVLRSAFEVYDSPCCFNPMTKVLHQEEGAEIHRCYGCGRLFAVVDDVTRGQQMFVGRCVQFEHSWQDEHGNAFSAPVMYIWPLPIEG